MNAPPQECSPNPSFPRRRRVHQPPPKLPRLRRGRSYGFPAAYLAYTACISVVQSLPSGWTTVGATCCSRQEEEQGRARGGSQGRRSELAQPRNRNQAACLAARTTGWPRTASMYAASAAQSAGSA